MDRLRAYGGKLQELSPVRSSLEDVFVDLVREGETPAASNPEAAVMRAFAASVQEVFREAAARWTLIAYFALSSLFILIFAAAVNLDIVDGALAGAKLFGQSVDLGDRQIDIDRVVLGFESGFSGFLYLVGTFLALFATAHLVPRLQEKGTIDLYLSRPIGARAPAALALRGGLLLAAANVALPHRLDVADRRLEDRTSSIPGSCSPARSSSSRSRRSWPSRFSSA